MDGVGSLRTQAPGSIVRMQGEDALCHTRHLFVCFKVSACEEAAIWQGKLSREDSMKKKEIHSCPGELNQRTSHHPRMQQQPFFNA